MKVLLALALFAQEPDVRVAALGRAAHELPRADAGAWDDRWDLEQLPADVKVRYGDALTAYQRGDLALALHHLQALLAEYPDFPAGLHQLGVVCFRLRRMGDAREAMQRFLAHAPQHVERTRVLGHAHYGLGDHAAARAHYARVLERNPGDDEARFGDALAAWRLGEEDAARVGMATVLEHHPAHADAAYWAARIAWETEAGEPEVWLARVVRAIELAPADPRPVYLHAQILLDLGLGDQAAEARARFERIDRLTRGLRALEERLLVAPDDVELLRRKLQLLGALGEEKAMGQVQARLLELRRGR